MKIENQEQAMNFATMEMTEEEELDFIKDFILPAMEKGYNCIEYNEETKILKFEK